MVVNVETIDLISWWLVFAIFVIGMYFMLRLISKMGNPKFRFRGEFWLLILLFSICVCIGVTWSIQLVKFKNDRQIRNEEESVKLFSDSFRRDDFTATMALDIFKRITRKKNRDNIVWTNPGIGSAFLPFMEKSSKEESYLKFHVFQSDQQKNDFISAVVSNLETLDRKQLTTENIEPYSRRERLDENGEVKKKGKFFAEPLQNRLVGHRGSTVRVAILEEPFAKHNGVVETLKGLSRVLLHSKYPPIFLKIPPKQRKDAEEWLKTHGYKEFTYLIGRTNIYFTDFRLFMIRKEDLREQDN